MSGGRAIILAAGRGTRMQRDDDTPLRPEQARAASAGAKAAIPVADDRPFLDYVLSGLADAGFDDVCIVVSPVDDVLRPRYSATELRRFRLSFAVQQQPTGTATALLAAESFVADARFVVLNSDNYYPVDALRRLREADGPATLAFSRAGLLRDGLIEPARLSRYAVLEIDDSAQVTNVIEKPDDASRVAHDDVRISMNVWRLDRRIFDACRAIQPSPRGEYELPIAVAYAVHHLGVRIRALPVDAPVLDLSHRADVPRVAARLRSVRVIL